MEESPPKVNRWDGNAVKNALDDAVKDSHRLLDGRLFISSVAVGFSLLALAWDYIYPFPQSRPILLTCVIAYFIMMAILTWYTTYLEQGIFCTAIKKDVAGLDPDDIWHASSTLKRFDNKYVLTLSHKSGKGQKRKEVKKTFQIQNFFDDTGKLVYENVSKEIIQLHNDVEHKKN